MKRSARFGAPWGMSLKVMTALSVLILLGVAGIGVFTGPREGAFAVLFWSLLMVAMPLLILVIAAFFLIRGYVLTSNFLLIQRLGWSSKLDLVELTSAEVNPKAMARSIRTCGNGGMFCFAGRFRNRALGPYRAFATDPHRSVVLRFTDSTVVLTPDQPEAFVRKIRELKGL